MNRIITHKIKALILFVIFSLNTMVGFACAIGLTLSRHDHNSCGSHSKAIAKPTAKKAKKHTHPNGGKGHCHVRNNGSTKKDCCNDSVISFQNLDKTLAHQIQLQAVSFTGIIPNDFYGIAIFDGLVINSKEFCIRPFHPPAPDIRIIICSFQI